jgi:hypothetical protein
LLHEEEISGDNTAGKLFDAYISTLNLGVLITNPKDPHSKNTIKRPEYLVSKGWLERLRRGKLRLMPSHIPMLFEQNPPSPFIALLQINQGLTLA